MAATNKRPAVTFFPDSTAPSKRWKSEAAWHHVEEMGVATEPPPPPPEFEALKVKTFKLLQEPTSVLDLQTSPGRSCSSMSVSSGDDSPHSSVSTGSPNFATTTSLHSEHEHEHDDLASWVDCMALPEFEECGRPLEEVLREDFDFGFELASLDSVGTHDFSVGLLSEFLGDGELLLPESFHDAQRLQELDESLSSMLSEVRSSASGESLDGVPTTAELVRLVEAQDLGKQGKNGYSHSHSHSHSRSESWGSTSEESTHPHHPHPPQPEDSGLQLVHLLLACAEAIEKSDFATARPILTQLSRISNPYGDPMQRIALYFGDALRDRLAHAAPPARALPDSKLAYQAFYKVLPFAKFSYVTANQTISEAVARSSRVHVLDLDIQQGLQWPCFIQSLAMRPGGAPQLRISAVGTNADALAATQRRLGEFAASFNVPFEFTPIVGSLDRLTPAMVGVRAGEDLVINCSQVLHTFLGEDGVVERLLAMLRTLNPSVVTLLEVEANHNGASFIARFVEALHYYCALFDSLEGALGRESEDRFYVESTALAGEIKDIVALQGGMRRARHVRSETWRALFAKAGFRAMAFSSYTVQQAQMLLELLTAKPAQGISPAAMPYKLSEESSSLVLGWQETPVIGVSAWSC